MRSYGNLFCQICDFGSLLSAHSAARRGKNGTPEVMLFHERAESNLLKLRDDLASGAWRPDPYREFLHQGTIKRRIIHAPTYRDRVVHHAIAQVILPLLERKWIYDSYACRVGKGAHAAVARLQSFLRRDDGERPYILQLDIAKYYPSVNHGILLGLLSRTLRDDRVMDLLGKILFGFAPCGTGIPIGAYTSQIFANVYLDQLDHFVKECLMKKWYLRYMDDMVVVGEKEELREAMREIRWLLEGVLLLKLNPKSSLFPASHGVDFCGYRTWRTFIRPRKRTIKAAKIRFRSLARRYAKGRIGANFIRPRVASFIGYIQHCSGRRTANSALGRLRRRKGESGQR